MPTCVLIPALKPCSRLLDVIGGLLAGESSLRIILVDDGSPAECEAIFQEAQRLPRVELIRHDRNRGKGAALRTGMGRFLDTAANHEVLVTADADGQHLPADILSVAERARKHSDSLVIGCRSFSGPVPFRSRFGNDLTRLIFRLLSGRKLADTQTGLRAIPPRLLDRLLAVQANRYEFELEMLMIASRLGVPFEIVPIQTVYLEGNVASHFNPLLDSIRIYWVFVRYLFR